ncbi:MAG: dihydropteroate synthase [Betaproteobacteria bacterium]|nr:dihydropteroate synthase [Betaproteobacteria bacterium]
MKQHLHCGRFVLSLDQPLIMGIVNLTDDSFSGDGLRGDAARAIQQGLRLVEEGAHILDLGGESSRPGAPPVSAQQELDRLLPVIESLRDCGVPLSVDTQKVEVMHAVLAAGADMINDIAALRAEGALEAVAESTAAVCLMHMQGAPQTMQQAPQYTDVVVEVADFLAGRVAAAEAAGIAIKRMVVDPGFGFGKTLEHNLALLRRLPDLHAPELPLLVGLSRKSMLGLLTGRAVGERLSAGIAAALLAVQRGAAIVRTHDVAPLRDAIAVWNAVEEH